MNNDFFFIARMEAQRSELLRQLPLHGWRVESVEDNLDWWADEVWLVESEWSPVGSQAYVTFMVDPMAGPGRRKGEAVWAVSASLTKPLSRLSAETEFTLSLGQGWKERLPDFFRHLSVLREHKA